MATNITCDRCGTTQQVPTKVQHFQSNIKPGWGQITVRMTINADPKADFLGGITNIINDICPACVLKMNLPIVENKVQMPTIESIIEDLIYDTIQEQE